jgi:release factor glutamine methyltransferase
VSDPLVARLRRAGCVAAEEEAALLREAAAGSGLEALVARRVAGEPLEHLLGWAAFCGLRVPVRAGVFVPRRRTGLLAERAVGLLRAQSGQGVAVDLCCGSGAVGLVLAAALPGSVEVHAADLDPTAVALARDTLAPHGVAVHAGDLFDALPGRLRGCVDVLVANAPYVPSDAVRTMPPEARDHEPLVALDGGADGSDLQRRVIAGASAWLAPGGTLFLETSRAQLPHLLRLARAHGLAPEGLRDEERGATALLARAPSA